jgi:hypothetical protein
MVEPATFVCDLINYMLSNYRCVKYYLISIQCYTTLLHTALHDSTYSDQQLLTDDLNLLI